MLLGIDIGNTNLTLGVFVESTLLHTFRLQSRREQTSDEYAMALQGLLELQALARNDVTHAVIASVVPALTRVLAQAVRRAFSLEALIVGPSTDVGVAMAVERPQEVGVDRIVNVAAARHAGLLAAGRAGADPGELLDAGAIVVDLGTATTLDCLSPSGEFLGGVIVPGMRVSFEALIARAPKLPDVELVAPARVLGQNTVQCLQSGIVHGYASLVDGLVAKLGAELPFEYRVLATGGLASTLLPYTTRIERVDVDLTLRGLYAIHDRARAQKTRSSV
jgi:type III pantothenate kinase